MNCSLRLLWTLSSDVTVRTTRTSTQDVQGRVLTELRVCHVCDSANPLAFLGPDLSRLLLEHGAGSARTGYTPLE